MYTRLPELSFRLVSALVFLFFGRPTHQLFFFDAVTHWVIIEPFPVDHQVIMHTILSLFFGSALAFFKKETSFFLTSRAPFEKSSPMKMVVDQILYQLLTVLPRLVVGLGLFLQSCENQIISLRTAFQVV